MKLLTVFTIEAYLYAALIGLLVWVFILLHIISAANETKRRDQIQLQNQKLLALMAKAMGVDAEKIEECLHKKKL